MSKTLVVFVALLCTIPLTGVAAESVSIVPLDEVPLTSAENALLSQLILRLEDLLADETLGSLRTRNATGWTSAAFAAYTGGSLVERGYRAYLASGVESVDGPHTWVVVGLTFGGRLVWLPIEPSPSFGAAQHSLGTIAWEAGGASGRGRFDPAYTGPVELQDLPPNAPPFARLRLDETQYVIGDRVRASAAGSFDADGEIVVYCWCVDDEACTSSSSWTYSPSRNDVGEHRLTLTVIDSGGRSATVSEKYVIKDPQDDAERKTGCGCEH